MLWSEILLYHYLIPLKGVSILIKTVEYSGVL